MADLTALLTVVSVSFAVSVPVSIRLSTLLSAVDFISARASDPSFASFPITLWISLTTLDPALTAVSTPLSTLL